MRSFTRGPEFTPPDTAEPKLVFLTVGLKTATSPRGIRFPDRGRCFGQSRWSAIGFQCGSIWTRVLITRRNLSMCGNVACVRGKYGSYQFAPGQQRVGVLTNGLKRCHSCVFNLCHSWLISVSALMMRFLAFPPWFAHLIDVWFYPSG